MANRLVEYHIARLQDKNPEVRLKSIRELALLGDKSAMEALEQVYRTDDDPEVRLAAQEAGKTIFFKQRSEPGQ
jgi:HEAT repeat protein